LTKGAIGMDCQTPLYNRNMIYGPQRIGAGGEKS
jgi:hypothetical protein